jgi:uncharacterized protein (DUF2249 family)
MRKKTVKLDVREYIRQGREPFPVIMQTVMALKPNESLLVYAPFKPAPLLQVMASRGFAHTAVEVRPDDWEILFEMPSETTPIPKPAAPPPCPKRSTLKK